MTTQFLSTKEFEAELDSSHSHFYTFWRKQPGFPPYVKLGARKHGYHRSAVEAFIASLTTHAAAANEQVAA